MTTGDFLRAAATEVRKGWCQYFAFRGQQVCAVGAIQRVAARHWRVAPCIPHVYSDALQALAALLPCSIAQWNDRSDQTQENVALMLEFAALVWDQQQTVKAENAAIEAPA